MNRQRKLSGNITEKRLVKVCLNRLMLQEGQQEQLGTPPPLSIDSLEESSEIVEEEDEREEPQVVRNPIVPRVVEPTPQTVPQFSFGSNFNGFYNYIPSNMALGSTNPVIFGFVFPNQFLEG